MNPLSLISFVTKQNGGKFKKKMVFNSLNCTVSTCALLQHICTYCWIIMQNNDNIDDGDQYKNNVHCDDSDSDDDGAIRNHDSQNDWSQQQTCLCRTQSRDVCTLRMFSIAWGRVVGDTPASLIGSGIWTPTWGLMFCSTFVKSDSRSLIMLTLKHQSSNVC